MSPRTSYTDRRGECARPGRGQTAIGAPDPRDRSAPGVRANRNTHALLRAPLTCGNRSPAKAAAQDHQEPTPRSPRSTQNFVDPTDPDARATLSFGCPWPDYLPSAERYLLRPYWAPAYPAFLGVLGSSCFRFYSTNPLPRTFHFPTDPVFFPLTTSSERA